jgi:hypothetical protein
MAAQLVASRVVLSSTELVIIYIRQGMNSNEGNILGHVELMGQAVA